MIQIQVAPFKDLSAVLAGVPITLKDIVPGELDLFLGQSIEQTKQNHSRNPNFERYRVDAVAVRVLRRKIAPLVKAESIERTVVSVEHDLCVALKQQSEGSTHGANIDRLPKAVQHQNVLIQV
jgi:hypothetical protein